MQAAYKTQQFVQRSASHWRAWAARRKAVRVATGGPRTLTINSKKLHTGGPAKMTNQPQRAAKSAASGLSKVSTQPRNDTQSPQLSTGSPLRPSTRKAIKVEVDR